MQRFMIKKNKLSPTSTSMKTDNTASAITSHVHFKRILRLLKVFGIWPYNLETGRVERKWFFFSIFIVLANVLFVATVAVMISKILVGESYNKYAKSFLYVTVMNNSLQSLGVLVSVLLHKNKVPNFIESSSTVMSQEFLSSILPPELVMSTIKKIRRIEMFAVVGSVLVFIENFALNLPEALGIQSSVTNNNITQELFISMSTVGENQEVPVWLGPLIRCAMLLFFTYVFFHGWNLVMFFTITCASVALILDCLAHTIRRAICEDDSECREDRLARLFRAHLRVSKYVEECNDMFGKPLASYLVCGLYSNLFVLYFLMTNILPSLLGTLAFINLLLMCNVCIFTACYIPATITVNAEGTNLDLYEFLSDGRATESEREKIKTFLERMLTCRVGIHVCHFFYLDKGLIITFSSIILTYVIVLLQMSPT